VRVPDVSLSMKAMFAKGKKYMYDLIPAAFKRNARFKITSQVYEIRSFSRMHLLSHITPAELDYTTKPGMLTCYSEDIRMREWTCAALTER
jgi:hypothetical protein